MVELKVGGPFVRCSNGTRYDVCNWVVRSSLEGGRCEACLLNRVIPDLSVSHNLDYWKEMEVAKRRVLVAMAHLGLTPQARCFRSTGVAFDFLSPSAECRVMTGHLNGIITMNILEADPIFREQLRRSFGEPQRCLSGHFRHEFGHYYWDQFFRFASSERPLTEFRKLFGDERADYGAALQNYYWRGPRQDWRRDFISAYASAHPWEDWAECWNAYLYIVEAVQTAQAFGCNISLAADLSIMDVPLDLGADAAFCELMRSWFALAPAMNEIEAGVGYDVHHRTSLPYPVLRKLHFVHVSTASISSWAGQLLAA